MPKKRKPIRAVVPRQPMPLGVIFRMFLMSVVAIGGTSYAVYRYYVERPAARAAQRSTPVPSATEIEAPELEK